MDFLDRLRILMDRAGDNNSTLAKKSGIPYTTIDGLFKRGWEKAQLSTIQKICEYYKVSLDYMVYGSDALSDEALLIAAKFENLDQRGRDVVLAVIDVESKHSGTSDKEKVLFKAVPLIGDAILDGSVETKEASKREQRELSHAEIALNSEKL